MSTKNLTVASMPKQKRKPTRKTPGIIFGSETVQPFGFWPLISILLLFVVIISFCNIRSLDLWWHLKTGEWISTQMSIPKTDPFSYSAAGEPWISHEWLFGLLSYLVYRAGGIFGIVGLKALLIAITFALSALIARVRGAKPESVFLILAGGYSVVRLRLSERPELLSLLLAAGFLLAYEKSRKHPWVLLSLPLMQLIWVNAHGGTALLGWALAGSLLIDKVCEIHHVRAASWRVLLADREILAIVGAFLGVVVLSFANPHGIRALLYGLLRTHSPLDNKEFQSFFRLMSDRVDTSQTMFIAFAALLLCGLLLRPRSLRVYEWMLFPMLLLLCLIYFRFRTLFVFLLAPAMAVQLSTGKWLGRLRWWLPVTAGVILMIYSINLERSTFLYRFGAGIHAKIFPQEAVEFIRESGLKGRMFNTYGFGGYLIWELWPHQKVFIDGREDVYLGPGVLEDYLGGFRSRASWQKLDDKYGFDFVIVNYPEQPPASIENSLEHIAFPRDSWGLVYFDDVAAIYVKRNGRNGPALEKYEIRYIQPLQLSAYLDNVIRDPERLSGFLEEIGKNMREHSGSFRAHFLMGILNVKRGPAFLGAAEAAFIKTSEINPDFAPAYVNLGNIYVHEGRSDEAKLAFKKALSIEKNAFAEEELRRLK